MRKYLINVYDSLDSTKKPDHTFGAKGKRQVVGLMKTIMDNFDPVIVEVISQDVVK